MVKISSLSIHLREKSAWKIYMDELQKFISLNYSGNSDSVQVGPDLKLKKFQVGFRTKGIFFSGISTVWSLKIKDARGRPRVEWFFDFCYVSEQYWSKLNNTCIDIVFVFTFVIKKDCTFTVLSTVLNAKANFSCHQASKTTWVSLKSHLFGLSLNSKGVVMHSLNITSRNNTPTQNTINTSIKFGCRTYRACGFGSFTP